MFKTICIVANFFPTRSETFVVEHAVGLARRGYTVTVLSQGASLGVTLAELEALDAAGVTRIDIQGYGLNRTRNLMQMLRRMMRKPQLIRSFFSRSPWSRSELFVADAYLEAIALIQPDVLHVHFGDRAGALCRQGLPLNAVVTWHGRDANELPVLCGIGMYHELFLKPYVHTVGSQFMVDRLQALGCPSDLIHQIPMGIDLGKFTCVDRSIRASTVLQIVSVGRLDEVKGHRYLIAATAELIARGVPVHVRIIGEGSLRQELEAQIVDCDLEDSIELLGAQDSEVVRQELAAADLFVLAGLKAVNGAEETQGIVLIEAQAMGLPVVTSRVGGVADSLIDGETGILCEPQHINQLAQAITRYAEDHALRLAHGQAAAEFVKQRFSLSIMLDSFEALYGLNPDESAGGAR